ncbi:RNA polymerase sigma factor [Massilibacterium senegalense]|uniref:RNA polymerase sigma factor n=1 Tax=Massilibacterium senegalense TaxID=1632858 RepID=UPI0007846072|nr:RNA polymerase sigma factor [Massilibacterium senegalense]
MPAILEMMEKEKTVQELFEKYSHRVYKTAFYIVKDPYLAQDVVQETFIKVYKNLDKVKDKDKISSWLTTVTTTTAIDEGRKRKRWNERTTDDVLIDNNEPKKQSMSVVEKKVEESDTQEMIYHCLFKLDPKFKEVLMLKYISELKDKEIAEALEINLGTVKSRLYRAKLKFKDVLRHHCTE